VQGEHRENTPAAVVSIADHEYAEEDDPTSAEHHQEARQRVVYGEQNQSSYARDGKQEPVEPDRGGHRRNHSDRLVALWRRGFAGSDGRGVRATI
jgi:hypothetical protein